jgi:hypothetical protein
VDAERAVPGAYWPRPWTCEDGGPRRLCRPDGQPGPDIGPNEGLRLAAWKDAFGADMVIRREPGELYALRHTIPPGDPLAGNVDGWVERLDPETLEVTGSTGRWPSGRYWPGGIAAHSNGDLYAVFGTGAHRLTPDLDEVASRRLPIERPYNSFVTLDSGHLVTKDCDAPRGRAPSTVSVLDPETLESAAPELELPEPSIARLSSDGETVIAVGTETVFRLLFDPAAGRMEIDETWRPRYGPAPGRGFGWDPVIADRHVFWMDQGRNGVDWTMVGSGEDPDPVRLWWCRRDDPEAIRSVEISGLPYGTESNPPAWDPVGGVVVAYDAGNAVVRAWRLDGDELEPLWRRDGLAHAGHLILFPDTREIVVQDYREPALRRSPFARKRLWPILRRLGRSAAMRRAALPLGRDSVVVLDLDTGAEKARAEVPSPGQAFLFPAPGFDRDLYYLSMTTIARLEVAPGRA